MVIGGTILLMGFCTLEVCVCVCVLACVRACEVSATSPPPLQIVMEYCGAGSVADIMRILDRTVSKGGAIPDRVGLSLGRGGAVTR